MNHDELEVIRQNHAASAQNVCAQYGLYGNVVNYVTSPIPGSSMNRMYLIAGFDKALKQDTLPKHIRPYEILRTLKRNEKLFYPRVFVMDLSETKDELLATQSLVDYCKTADFLSCIYGEYGLPVPTVLRHSEVRQLIKYYSSVQNTAAPAKLRQKARKDLDWFFKREASRNKFRQKWLSYFRSDKFPDDKGPLQRLLGFYRQSKCEVTREQLMDIHPQIGKLELQEYEYVLFRKIIQERYPFVTYAVGDKEVVDHGLSKATENAEFLLGKPVSAEEYAVIRKDRFAEEGWDCVANLQPAYWEFRDIFYKKCDEPVIASVYQHISLQYAKSDSLGELKQRGPLLLQKVPANDFMNFVSLAKANHVRFYIDVLGEYETPNLDTVNVLYNEAQQDKMSKLIERMIRDKVSYSHVLNTPTRPSLNSVIEDIESINRNSIPNRSRTQLPHEK